MSGRYVIAKGGHEGMTWVIWARRDEPHPGDLFSMIRVTDGGGRIMHARGLSGPALYPGHVLNVTTSGSDEGPRSLLARVHPTVRRLAVRAQDGTTRNVPLYDCSDIPEVRFAVALLPRELELESVAGFGAKGAELERFDLRFQQGQWEARHCQVG
jgi:hypothetical protein